MRRKVTKTKTDKTRTWSCAAFQRRCSSNEMQS